MPGGRAWTSYLSKPIKGEELIEIVERLTADEAPKAEDQSPKAQDQSPKPEDQEPKPQDPFDLADATAKCFGNYEMFQEMAGYLFAEVEPVLREMRAAHDRGDARSWPTPPIA